MRKTLRQTLIVEITTISCHHSTLFLYGGVERPNLTLAFLGQTHVGRKDERNGERRLHLLSLIDPVFVYFGMRDPKF